MPRSKQPRITIGVLALQGSFREHTVALQHNDGDVIEVRNIEQAEQTDGLVIPGGESTTIGKLLKSTKLDSWIKRKAKTGYPIYGTCAGCILVAKDSGSEYSLGLIDIDIQRNAYGSQLDSFEAPLDSPIFSPMTGIFIRAPRIIDARKTDVLASLDGEPVLVRNNNILAGTFHPELTDSTAIHDYFVEMVRDSVTQNS